MSKQPYKLGRGSSVGGAVAKSFADVGTAISDAVTARSSVKKHQLGLAHLTEQAELGRKHEIHVIGVQNEHEARMHQLGTESGIKLAAAASSLAATHGDAGRNVRLEATPTTVKFETSTGRAPKTSGSSKAGAAVGKAVAGAVAGAVTKNPKVAAAAAKVGEAAGAKAGELASKGAKAVVTAVKNKAAAKPKPAAPKKPTAAKGVK